VTVTRADRASLEVIASWLRLEDEDCGDNVELARDLVSRTGLGPSTVALVQDPTMQRRMDAVARRVRPGVHLVNRPGPDSRR
jgi:uncharacterized SAM-binding protein YcdF (DUF218 family)